MIGPNGPFLRALVVGTSADGQRNALLAAVRRNKIYAAGASGTDREEFRRSWGALLIERATTYYTPVTDSDHCRIIGEIADLLSSRFGCILTRGRLHFGTSQKAFNLYLKFLWRLGHLPKPPHCPMDRIVLRTVGLSVSWTKSDSEIEYMEWVTACRVTACRELGAGASLADWEYSLWNASAQGSYPRLGASPSDSRRTSGRTR